MRREAASVGVHAPSAVKARRANDERDDEARAWLGPRPPGRSGALPRHHHDVQAPRPRARQPVGQDASSSSIRPSLDDGAAAHARGARARRLRRLFPSPTSSALRRSSTVEDEGREFIAEAESAGRARRDEGLPDPPLHAGHRALDRCSLARRLPVRSHARARERVPRHVVEARVRRLLVLRARRRDLRSHPVAAVASRLRRQLSAEGVPLPRRRRRGARARSSSSPAPPAAGNWPSSIPGTR